MHAFGGSDSTSQFAGRGKKTTMKLLLENPKFLDAMCSLGTEFVPTHNTLQQAESAICIMYSGAQYTNTNDVRNYKWNRSTKDITKLPPCHDSAVLHIRRANYQAAVWRRCLLADMNAPSPHGHGWTVSETDISIVWMTQPRAPESILNSMKCRCKSSLPCSTKRCGCRHRGVACTDLCMCENCGNRDTPDLGGYILDDSDESDVE